MTIIPLGKIQVPTPGTPIRITLTSAQAAQLHKSGVVAKMEIWADTTDTGVSYVKHAATGWKIASLPVPANGQCEHWEGLHLDPVGQDSRLSGRSPRPASLWNCPWREATSAYTASSPAAARSAP